MYLLQKDFPNAFDDYSKSIALKSSVQADSYFFRGLVKQSMNDTTACDDFKTAKQLGFKNEGRSDSIDELCNPKK